MFYADLGVEPLRTMFRTDAEKQVIVMLQQKVTDNGEPGQGYDEVILPVEAFQNFLDIIAGLIDEDGKLKNIEVRYNG